LVLKTKIRGRLAPVYQKLQIIEIYWNVRIVWKEWSKTTTLWIFLYFLFFFY
jgi:hypothetical protein